MLTRVAQIVTAAHRLVILHGQTYQYTLIAHQKLGQCEFVTYFTGQNHPPQKVGLNRHVEAS